LLSSCLERESDILLPNQLYGLRRQVICRLGSCHLRVATSGRGRVLFEKAGSKVSSDLQIGTQLVTLGLRENLLQVECELGKGIFKFGVGSGPFLCCKHVSKPHNASFLRLFYMWQRRAAVPAIIDRVLRYDLGLDNQKCLIAVLRSSTLLAPRV